MSWPIIDMEEMIENGLIKLGRGKVISKLDIAACPGTFPIYSSARLNDGKFGEYGRYEFDQELITWSVDGGGQFFYRPKHKFSVTNVAGTLEILHNEKLDYRYLHYVLSDKHSRLVFDWTSKAHPSVIRRLYKEIPLPPLDDQIRIAHLLNKVEGLIAQRKENLQQLDELLKSVFLEMFGDPVRNEKGWDKPELKKFGKISTGNTPPRKDNSSYSSRHIEWIKTDNIPSDSVYVTQSTEYLSESGSQKGRIITKGALLIACIAGSVESIGRAALTNRTVSFNQQINAIQPSKDVNSFFLYVLFKISKAYIQSHATKGMKKILTKGDFEKIKMIKPPIDLQNQFATIVEKVESLKSRYQSSLTELQNLYGALSQKAFKGELDLSRIALTKVATDEVKPVAPVSIEEKPSIELPAPADLSNLTTAEVRLKVFAQWLDSYLEQLGGEAFSAAHFMELAQQRLWELLEDDAYQLSVTEYDHVKQWLFNKLDKGHISQRLNIISKPGEGFIHGNQILLKKAQ